jgi:hypothetical protein
MSPKFKSKSKKNKPNASHLIFDDLLALITEKMAARFLGVTPRALQAWRLRGTGPKFIRISLRCVRYRKRELIDFSDDRLKSSTSQE